MSKMLKIVIDFTLNDPLCRVYVDTSSLVKIPGQAEICWAEICWSKAQVIRIVNDLMDKIPKTIGSLKKESKEKRKLQAALEKKMAMLWS